QGAVKPYHSELSDILRDFLERRYRIPAMEQTTDEIFTALAATDLPDRQKARLRQVLTLADLVKFAREQLLHTDNEQSMAQAIEFVEEAAVCACSMVLPLPTRTCAGCCSCCPCCPSGHSGGARNSKEASSSLPWAVCSTSSLPIPFCAMQASCSGYWRRRCSSWHSPGPSRP